MHTKSSYFDFFFNGVSFASNKYFYSTNQKPWEFPKNRLADIQDVWSKNFWLSAGLSTGSGITAVVCSTATTSPYATAILSMGFFVVSIFSTFRLCQALNQTFSWDPKLFVQEKNLDNIQKSIALIQDP